MQPLFSQTTATTIQVPTVPSISAPSVVAPTIPTLQMTSTQNNGTVKTTTETTANGQSTSTQTAPSNLSTELSTSALETLSSLFTGDDTNLQADALGSIGNFSSIGDLTSLLNQEMSTTTDTTTQALLQEILIKLSELEAKIDNLEKSEQAQGTNNE